MKRLRNHLLAVSILAIGLSACETVSNTGPTETTQAKSIDATASNYELVNRSEVVATVKSRNVAVDLERQALEWGYTLKKKEKLDGLNLFLLTFDCPPGVDPKDASLELERLQPKSSVGEIHRYTLSSSTVSYALSNMPKTFANEMLQWPETGCESLAKIGIIDGGLSKTFLNNTSANIHEASFIEGISSKTATMHGTSIGAILTDPKRLKNVELYSAAVVSRDKNGNDYSSPISILKALNWMLLNDVKVVNISLSGPPNKVLESALDVATEKGLIIVAAVGNQGQNSKPQFPAAYQNVLAATAVDIDGDIYRNAVRGSHVDFAAPGVDVYIKTADEDQYISGTSIAAPFITAAIASSSTFTDDRNRDEVIRHFSDTATDLGPKGKDNIYGLGLLNAKHICDL